MKIKRGTLNMADVFEIKQIKSKKVAFAVMSERIEMRMKESQNSKWIRAIICRMVILWLLKQEQNQICKLLIGFQLKAQLEDLKHKHRMAGYKLKKG